MMRRPSLSEGWTPQTLHQTHASTASSSTSACSGSSRSPI